MKKDNFKKGKLGEDAACVWLEQKGHQILERNYRRKTGEIDIISRIDTTYVFTEVKLRTGTSYGSPGEAVDYRRQQRIVRTALLYISEQTSEEQAMRFDVIEILLREGKRWIRHFENAFSA